MAQSNGRHSTSIASSWKRCSIIFFLGSLKSMYEWPLTYPLSGQNYFRETIDHFEHLAWASHELYFIVMYIIFSLLFFFLNKADDWRRSWSHLTPHLAALPTPNIQISWVISKNYKSVLNAKGNYIARLFFFVLFC